MKKCNYNLIFTLFLCLLVGLSGCAEKSVSSNRDAEKTLSSLNVTPIQFGVLGDGNSIDNHKVLFSKASLTKVDPNTEVFVSYTPTPISVEKLVKKLNICQKRQTESRVVYENDTLSLDVYPNGNFCLFSKEQEAEIMPITISDEACVEIANAFLLENGLLCDDLVLSKTIGQDKVVGEEGTVIIGKVITYHPKTISGASLFGNSKVSVRVSAEGLVTELIYNHLHYNNEEVFVLLDPKEAFEQAREQKNPTAIYFEALDEVPKELTVENVRIAYYENVMSEVPSRQPVYILEGGSGETQFAISVSAIKQ